MFIDANNYNIVHGYYAACHGFRSAGVSGRRDGFSGWGQHPDYQGWHAGGQDRA
jgi:hypothetical protein